MSVFTGETITGYIPTFDVADIRETLCRPCFGIFRYDETSLFSPERAVEQDTVKGIIKAEKPFPIKDLEEVAGTIRNESSDNLEFTGNTVFGNIETDYWVVGGYIPFKDSSVEIETEPILGFIKEGKIPLPITFNPELGSISYPFVDTEYNFYSTQGLIFQDLSIPIGLAFEDCCGYIPDFSHELKYVLSDVIEGVIPSEVIGSAGFKKVEYELPVEIGTYQVILKTSSRIIDLSGLDPEKFLSESQKVVAGTIAYNKPFTIKIRTEDLVEYNIKIIPYYSWKKRLFKKI